MKKTSRIGDQGQGRCTCHDSPRSFIGELIEGSPDTFVEEISQSRLGDKVKAPCGHTGVMVQGSPDIFVNGHPLVRIGDRFEGCFTGIIIGGASTSFGN